MKEARVIVVGATGMIGGIVLRRALADARVTSIATLGRRGTGLDDPKLEEIEHADFMDLTSVQSSLGGVDVAHFCLGAYSGTVPDDVFRKVTVDYTIEFARALFAESPEAAICLLSGQGADSTEKSRIKFARYKGIAENALLRMGFPRVHIFRPGYIYPTTPRSEPSLSYRMLRVAYPALRRIYPNIGVSSEDLANTMFDVGLAGTPRHDSPILENKDIRRLSSA